MFHDGVDYKIQSQPESKSYLVWMFRTLSPGDSISRALRKLLQGGRREVRLYTSLQQGEQAVWIAKNRYQVKEFSILCLGRCEAPGLLNSCLSHAPQLSGANPVYLASGSPPAPQQSWTEGGSIHWITVWGAPIHFWRPEITHGRDIFCLLIWPEIFSFYNGKQMTTISQDIN